MTWTDIQSFFSLAIIPIGGWAWSVEKRLWKIDQMAENVAEIRARQETIYERILGDWPASRVDQEDQNRARRDGDARLSDEGGSGT
jgi:hypothetical protein